MGVVHSPDGVAKTRVFGTRENIERKAELLDPPEPLKKWGGYYFPLDGGQRNKTIDRIVNDMGANTNSLYCSLGLSLCYVLFIYFARIVLETCPYKVLPGFGAGWCWCTKL